MKLGFNSNVEVGGAVYHVQTEDRGVLHPFVDTLILSSGRVVLRRSNSYQDLLTETALDEASLRERVERQHRDIVEGLRSGQILVDEPRPSGLLLRLCNPGSWLAGGQASLEIEVLSDPEKRPMPEVEVVAFIEWGEGEESAKFTSQTGRDGRARLSFRMPELEDDENPVLVIRLEDSAEPILRYRLKPKSPASAPSAS
jgi:hypothetical protein